MAYAQVIEALADPTRRTLYETLRRRYHSVGELAGLLEVSQPAVSQHLKVLREAELVTHVAEGTTRRYRASTRGLEDLRAWIESFWDDVLSAYAADDPTPPVQRPRPKSKTKRARKP